MYVNVCNEEYRESVMGGKATMLAEMTAFAEKLDEHFKHIVGVDEEGKARVRERIRESIRYISLGVGKKFRGYLLSESSYACGVDRYASSVLGACVALEMLHSYSLVHDDLPSMDNAEMRRGRRALHRQYDEATAILAGDALLTLSFEVLSKLELESERRLGLIQTLTEASGLRGMVGGQMLDIWYARSGEALDIDTILKIYKMKSAYLIGCGCKMGGIVGGADTETQEGLYEYGLQIGLAFQIVDDILDYHENSEEINIVKVIGMDSATKMARSYVERGKELVSLLFKDSHIFIDIGEYTLARIE